MQAAPFFPLPQETFDTYRRASGLGSQSKVATALQRWGPNQFDVPLPPFTSLLKVRCRTQTQLLAPPNISIVVLESSPAVGVLCGRSLQQLVLFCAAPVWPCY